MSAVDDLKKCYAYADVDDEQKSRMAEIRRICQNLGADILGLVPESREQSLALTNLEQVMFWANAGIARNSF